MQQALLTIGSFAITGFLVSGFVQWTKQWFTEPQEDGRKFLYALAVSAVGGGVLYLLGLVPTEWWSTILLVYTSMNTVFLAVFRKNS